MALTSDIENKIWIVRCQDCGLLIYCRFAEDAERLASKHGKKHKVLVNSEGEADLRVADAVGIKTTA